MSEIAHKAEPHGGSQKSIGRIISVNGSQAIVLLNEATGDGCEAGGPRPVMGTLLRVNTPRALVLGLVSAQSVPVPTPNASGPEIRIVELELVGEILLGEPGGAPIFKRGVSRHPSLGDLVYATSGRELEMAYSSQQQNIKVGSISQDPNIPARVLVDELLSKHFAVLGTTGTGKSCGVALILQSILKASPNAHILLLDPHNEYVRALGDKAEVITLANLDLPYWLFTFEEIVEVVMGSAVDAAEEVEIFAELMPILKRKYALNRYRTSDLSLRKDPVDGPAGYTVDTPTPYRISDLLEILDQRMGSLELKNALRPYKRLKARIEAVTNDPRYAFMFGKTAAQDQMSAVLGRLFRIPVQSKPVAIVQLTGLPSEVVNVLVSVICRLSFEFAMWSEGRVPIMIVCEEAHKYIPTDHRLGFDPTRRAIARIAKEGRKYAVSLCVISQRPGELDPTILSQCSTVFALRLSNEDDQQIVRAAISDAAASLLEFLPALGEREAIGFGDGVTLPMRFRFLDLPPDQIPKGRKARFTEQWKLSREDGDFVDAVVDRWRAANSADTHVDECEQYAAMAGGEMQQETGPFMQPAAPRPYAEEKMAAPARTAGPAASRADMLKEPTAQRSPFSDAAIRK